MPSEPANDGQGKGWGRQQNGRTTGRSGSFLGLVKVNNEAVSFERKGCRLYFGANVGSRILTEGNC